MTARPKSPDSSDLQLVVYVLAVEDPAKAVKDCRAEAQVNANIELWAVSEGSLNALKLAPGRLIHV